MTADEQRIAIATACGWRIVQTTKYAWVVICPSNIERAWSSHDGVMNDKPASYYLPDYLGDLNAMHEAEMILPRPLYHVDYWQKGYGRFQTLLAEFTITPYSATAAQRAEAFLRTLNLWQPTPTQPQ
jgi:hypothetical protein